MTSDMGIVTAFATGAKSIKSKRGAATGLLSYSDFTLSKKGDTYRISEASVNRVFFGAGSDIETLTLAQYFCELAYLLYPADGTSTEFLRLILNSLHFLSEKKRPQKLIKAITELRIAAISGYAPNLIACDVCGKFEDDIMYFSLSEGCLYCKNCEKKGVVVPVFTDVLKAMRHIVYSDFEKIYSFELSEGSTVILSDLTEKYITYQTEHNFKTLDFYKTLVGTV